MSAEPVRMVERCGHGLVAWKVDGYLYHERKDPTYSDGTVTLPSRGLVLDGCDRPAAERRPAAKGRK